MLKTIAILGIMALLFFLVYVKSEEKKLTKAVVAAGLISVIGFGGPYFIDFIGNIELPSHNSEDVPSESSSHTHIAASSEEENIIDATCTTAGSYDLVSYCECGQELSRESLHIFALGHDYTEMINAPSCDESGFTTYKCSRCNDTYEDDYTEALGHNYIDGICSRCGKTDPDYKAPDPADTEYTAKKVKFITYNGAIRSEDQTDSYKLKTSISGFYRFDMSDMINGFKVRIYIYDSKGNEIYDSYSLENDEGFTCELKKKNNYTIKVEGYSNTGKYTLTIGQPKKSVNITDFEIIKDSIEYTDQQNIYTFVPSINGRYRFEFSEVISGFKISLHVYDALDYTVDGDSGFGNDEGITVYLTAGEKYTIKIDQYTDLGSYMLSIGKQQATTDISGKTDISGNIAYKKQQNIYTYTPSVTGEYTMSLQNMFNGFEVELRVYDYLDYEIDGDYMQNGDKITVELTAGKTYTVYLIQSTSYGDYNLKISFGSE